MYRRTSSRYKNQLQMVIKMQQSVPYEPRKRTTLTQVYDSVWPVMGLCRIFGTIPIARFKRLGEIVLEASHQDRFHFMLYLAANVILLLYVGQLFVHDQVPIGVTAFFAAIFLTLFVVCLLTTLILAFWNRKVIAKFFEVVAKIDCKAKSIGIEIDYDQMFRSVLKKLVVMIVFVASRTAIFILNFEVCVVHELIFTYILFMKYLVTNQFICLSLLLSQRFDVLKSQVEDIAENVDMSAASEKMIQSKLYWLYRLHYKLCDLCRLLDETYGFQMLLSLTFSVANVLVQTYYIYALLSQGGQAWALVGVLIWLVGETTEIFWLVDASATTCNNANDFGATLHELQNTVKDSRYENYILTFSLQLVHQKLSYSASGFFDINYPILYSLFVTVMTYLVIIVQYDEGDSQKSIPVQNCSDYYSDDYDVYANY